MGAALRAGRELRKRRGSRMARNTTDERIANLQKKIAQLEARK